MTTRERIDEAIRLIRGNSPEIEIPKVRKARLPYKWGAKQYLSSFEIGETREHTDEFRWGTLRCMASRLKSEYNCRFTFCARQGKQLITRVG